MLERWGYFDMGAYTCRPLEEKEYHKLVETIRNGYVDHYGCVHAPNGQIATILVLEANLGCRIGDIVAMETDSIIQESGVWKLNITEQKTGKKRSFIVPQELKDFIDEYARVYERTGKLFTITCQAVWKCLRQVTKYLGLENCSSHSLRKFAAQNIYRKSNYDISLVCQFLQHSSPKITQVYLERSSKQMDEAISKMITLA